MGASQNAYTCTFGSFYSNEMILCRHLPDGPQHSNFVLSFLWTQYSPDPRNLLFENFFCVVVALL